MQKTPLLLSTLSILALGACATDDGGSTTETESELRGDATFRDAETDHAGNPIDAAAPSSDGTITLVIEGTGQLPDVDARCELDPSGRFEAHYVSSVDFDAGDAYVSSVAEGVIMTPGGCELPTVTALLVTDVRLRAEIEATSQNCETYCAASARADAEAECAATTNAASCRENAEAAAEASCTTTCETRADRIVAEASLAATLFAGLDFEALQGALFGDLTANFEFDHMVDASGNEL
ncbi:MAG: hypothetical protein AB7L94_32835 [Kofleriaceae bacterium]